ncbi:MAG: tRNA (adenosine(37)-N6)-threonylcarbamoyltransferase complex dimerization subunit type 1 TsaB, partial [Muribaculaceae bacterium]|nr:tRNA (adenosine(37)-N6)-threonylcarbamoyltransferase complex dimerization subunit type 1 TsaB [Muribaculaceae bacterium]
MSVILNIETSGECCSVALTQDGMVEYHAESEQPMQHAVLLAQYVDKALEHAERRELHIDAVAVSIGPGSYTGLRIGMSLAKGLCFAKDIPLIGINTLELLAVKGMFSIREPEGDEVLIGMIDARRMEVYAAAYDFALNPLLEPKAIVLDSDSFAEFADRKVVAAGSGVAKAKDVLSLPEAKYLDARLTAMDMTALSERAFRRGDFMDPAYGVPFYLKDYEAKKSTNKVLEEA